MCQTFQSCSQPLSTSSFSLDLLSKSQNYLFVPWLSSHMCSLFQFCCVLSEPTGEGSFRINVVPAVQSLPSCPFSFLTPPLLQTTGLVVSAQKEKGTAEIFKLNVSKDSEGPESGRKKLRTKNQSLWYRFPCMDAVKKWSSVVTCLCLKWWQCFFFFFSFKAFNMIGTQI